MFVFESLYIFFSGAFVQLGTFFIAMAGVCLLATPLWKGAPGLAVLFGLSGFMLASIGNQPMPKLPQQSVYLTVKPWPEDSVVMVMDISQPYIDGMELLPGTYKINVRYTNSDKIVYKERTETISLKSGENMKVFIRILPPLNTSESPKGEGDAEFVKKTNAALKLLDKVKENGKSELDLVKKHIDTIKQDYQNYNLGAMKTRAYPANELNPTFHVGKFHKLSSVISYAGAIAHDAFHAKQYDDEFNNACYKNDKRRYIMFMKSLNYACGYPLAEVWTSEDKSKPATAEIEALQHQLYVLRKIPNSEREQAWVQCQITEGKGRHADKASRVACYYYKSDDLYVESPPLQWGPDMNIEFSRFNYTKGFCNKELKIGLRAIGVNPPKIDLSWNDILKTINTEKLLIWAESNVKKHCAKVELLTISLLTTERYVVEKEFYRVVN